MRLRYPLVLVSVVLLLATPGLADVVRVLTPPAHRDAVDEVVTVMRDLGLVLPAGVQVYVYDTRAAFRRGLIDEAYVATDRVEEIASFAAGLARPGRVLLHSKAARGRREWRRLIAHELTHVAQFALAGGDGRADQWLAEGVEMPGDERFVLGVQWHPEELVGHDQAARNLFAAVVDAARRRSHR